MKKRIFYLLSFCATLFSANMMQGEPVDEATAMRVARTHLIQKSDVANIELTDVTSLMPYRNIYFFLEKQGRGFVLVSADDRAIPILGYSTENTFYPADLPEHIADWFRQYDEQIDEIIANDIKATTEISDEWERLIQGRPESAERAREKSVSPLLTTKWGQGGNSGSSVTYNSLCPHSGSTYAVAGCVAIATAQVMKYWNHPTTGRGSHSYTHRTYGTQSANFGNTTYSWSSMPDQLTSSSAASQKTAVATLIYHVGVACEMDYSASGSGASTGNYGSITLPSAENALLSNFKYSSTIHSIDRSNFTDAEWIALLKGELDASTPRPILYSGRDASSGHAFVFDGYNNSNQFHVNWGWDGRYDGYFTIGALNPGTGGTGGSSSGTYNYSNQAVIGIKPAPNSGSSFTVTTNVNNSSYGSVSGTRSYNSYDTVSIVANTQEGYRFKQWSDGCKANPRQFILNDNVTFTAQLEKIQGDTLYYTRSYPFTYLGLASGNTYEWGVKFPASALTAQRKPSKLLFFAQYTGSYTISVYNDGANAPSNMLFTGSVSLTSTNQLGYIALDISSNNSSINANKPLWVVLKYKNTSASTIYCIPMTYYGGNQYSKMRKSGNSWSAMSYTCSWVIQLINQYTSTPPTGITEATIEDGYTITNGKGIITVTGAEEETVRFIDNSGRVIATDGSNNADKTFKAPASGVYLIQVGNKPAKKVVVKK